MKYDYLEATDENLAGITKQELINSTIVKESEVFSFVADEVVLYSIAKNQGGLFYIFLIKDGFVQKIFKDVNQIHIDANPEKHVPFIIKYLSGNKIRMQHPIFKLIFEKIADNVTIKVDNFLKL